MLELVRPLAPLAVFGVKRRSQGETKENTLVMCCGPATEPENPRIPKIRKNKQNPPPRGGPPKLLKKYRKIQKRPKNGAICGPFLYFFGIFQYFSGAHPGVGDFVFFSGIFGILGFSGSVAGPQHIAKILVMSCLVSLALSWPSCAKHSRYSPKP